MNILVAADSFKGSISSEDVKNIFEDVGKKFDNLKVEGILVADGGEGSVDALIKSGGFRQVETTVCGPLFAETVARYAVRGNVAAIEMAAASGLTLIPYGEHNALKTTTFGTGELIMHAIERGADEILLFCGGSATNDGGAGALTAMGFCFSDESGNAFVPTGATLCNVVSVEKSDYDFSGVTFKVLADVTNPLVGKSGATYVYGRQKGASEADLQLMEDGMNVYADVSEAVTGVKIKELAGAGAAGGIAAGFAAYLGATIQSGADEILRLTGFYDSLNSADAVITGEGKIDEQTLYGKIVSRIAAAAKNRGIPLYGICGITDFGEAEANEMGFSAVETLAKYAPSKEESINNAKKYLCVAAEKLLLKIMRL